MSYEAEGGFGDILAHVSRLTRSPDDAGTLVIQVVDAEPFIQFGGGAGGVELDFPMVTKGQRERETAFRRFLDERALKVRVTFGSDGAEFLDVDLPGDPHRVAQVARDVLTQVFGVDPSARLSFMGEGVGSAP